MRVRLGQRRGDSAQPRRQHHRSSDIPSATEHDVRLLRLSPDRKLLDGLAQRLGVGEEGHDVLEDDSRLREVRDVPDLGREVH